MSFNDMTLDYDAGTNFILALDRGEQPPINEYDNFVYLIKRFVARMRQADFKYLHPAIQQNYAMAVRTLQQLEVERQQKLMVAQQGLIPTGGYMVTVDFYVSDPKDPMKTRRAKVPYQSLEWLIKALESQGNSLADLEKMNQGALAQMAEMSLANQGGSPAAIGNLDPTQGAGMPGGVTNVGNFE